MRAHPLGFLFVLFLLLRLGNVRADVTTPALNYARAVGAEGCIDPKALAARIEAITQTTFVSSSQTAWVLEVLVEPHHTGFRATIAMGGRGPERDRRVLRESTGDCRKLDAALVFVLSLMVDPTLASRPLPQELQGIVGLGDEPPEELLLRELTRGPGISASREAAAAPELPTVVRKVTHGRSAAEESRSSGPRTQYIVGLGPALSWFALPEMAWGGSASVSSNLVRFAWLAVDLRAFPVPVLRPLPSGEHMTIRTYDFALTLCPLHRQWKRFFAMLCAGPSLDVLSAQGRGFDRNHRSRLWIPSGSAAISMRIRVLGRFGLQVDFRGRVRFTAPTFVSSSTDEAVTRAYRPHRFGLALALGPYVEF